MIKNNSIIQYIKFILVLYFLIILTSSLFAGENNDMVTIPEGEFKMGCSHSDTKCGKDEANPGGITVFVPFFAIDKFEVTVADYTECIEAGNCVRPKDNARNKYCNFGEPSRSKHPVNCVDWGEALSYCEWKGKRLPYEAEWEKAARGGTITAYPWGNDVDCTNAILDDGVTFGSVPNEPDGCGEDRTWEIASRDTNQFGLYDMHGNAGEWTMNWYSPNAITEYYSEGNLTEPQISKQKVVRGGSWDENRKNLRSSYRNVKPPVSGKSVYGSIGFRCAMNL